MLEGFDPRKFGFRLKLSWSYGNETRMFRGMNPANASVAGRPGVVEQDTFNEGFSREDMIDQLLEDSGYQDQRDEDHGRANWGNYDYAASFATPPQMPESGVVLATSLGNLKDLGIGEANFTGPEGNASIERVPMDAIDFVVTSPYFEEEVDEALDTEVYSPDVWPERPEEVPEDGFISDYTVPDEVINGYAEECNEALEAVDLSAFYDRI